MTTKTESTTTTGNHMQGAADGWMDGCICYKYEVCSLLICPDATEKKITAAAKHHVSCGPCLEPFPDNKNYHHDKAAPLPLPGLHTLLLTTSRQQKRLCPCPCTGVGLVLDWCSGC